METMLSMVLGSQDFPKNKFLFKNSKLVDKLIKMANTSVYESLGCWSLKNCSKMDDLLSLDPH